MPKFDESTLDESRTFEHAPFSPTLARLRSFEPPATPPTAVGLATRRLWFTLIALGLLAIAAAGYLIAAGINP